MKRHICHTICAWALLFCFIAGQYMVYAHQHHVNKQSYDAAAAGKLHIGKQLLKEKCAICHSMQHSFMELTKPQFAFYNPCTDHTCLWQYYIFESLNPVLSSGRAPPVKA